MDKKRIILMQAGTIDDIRMPKEIEVMKQGGYAVTVLSWDRDCKKSHHEHRAGAGKYYEELQLRLKAPIGIKLLLILPIWWFFEFFWFMRIKWDIAHVLNFHSIIPGLIAGKLKRKPVIYEIVDSYEDMTALPNILRYFLIQVDRIFMRLASAVIIVDEAQENRVFTLFYAGRLHKARRLNLDKIVSAISSINNVKLIIAGYGDQVEEVEKWSHAMPNKIQFIGKISYDDALERSIAADLLFEVRDPVIPLHKYICGSKFLRAMSCGKPILVSKGTSAANKVYENNCGLVVDTHNIEEIKNAIIMLRDNLELCRELGANGRKAYEERYSWEIMERRLLALYQGLTGEIGKGWRKDGNKQN
jgi:glycosyltransferase involved in cell wall biosynthesis